MKNYQITIRSATGTTIHTGLYASSMDASIDAMDYAPAGASISVKLAKTA